MFPMISTRDLSALPDIDALKRLMQSMAMLDAVLSPEWQYRYYSFNAKWAKGEQMGSMRNGSGDDLHALFTKDGCFLKGFGHESPMTPYALDPKRVWPGVLDAVPREFDRGLNQPAFAMADTTFCLWRTYSDDDWQCGLIEFPDNHPDPDGSGILLSAYDRSPETYLVWAKGYFDLGAGASNLTLDHVRHVYTHEQLTTALVRAINPEVTLKSLAADITEIGYPRRKK
jgi:hypothetical protein